MIPTHLSTYGKIIIQVLLSNTQNTRDRACSFTTGPGTTRPHSPACYGHGDGRGDGQGL
jgi:hypothetical protein